MRRVEEDDCRRVIEVHAFSYEQRGMMQQRLHGVFAASGCSVVESRRRGPRAVEYSFKVALDAIVELYCGLLQVGVEMTGVSHRAMAELCMLRSYQAALRRRSGTVRLRLVMSCLEVLDVMEASAGIAAR